MEGQQDRLATALAAVVRGYVQGWIAGNPNSEEQHGKMEALKVDAAQAVEAAILAAGKPVDDCPGEYRLFAMNIYAALLVDIGTMFADAGREAKAAMHHIEDVALTMMKNAAEAARQEQGEGEP